MQGPGCEINLLSVSPGCIPHGEYRREIRSSERKRFKLIREMRAFYKDESRRKKI